MESGIKKLRYTIAIIQKRLNSILQKIGKVTAINYKDIDMKIENIIQTIQWIL